MHAFLQHGLYHVLLLLCLHINGKAQFPATGMGTLASNGQRVFANSSPAALFTNPAALQARSASMWLHYQSPFAVRGLHFGSVATSLPWRHLVVGLGLRQLHHRLYRDTELRAALNFIYIRRVQAALAIALRTATIPGYYHEESAGWHLGLGVKASAALAIGATLQTARQFRAGSPDLRLAIRYCPDAEFCMTAEATPAKRVNSAYRFSLSWRANELMMLQAGSGLRTPGMLAAGFEITKGWLRIAFGFQMHAVLGAHSGYDLTLGGS